MITRREWLIASSATVVVASCHHAVVMPPDAASCATSDPQIVFMDPCDSLDPICEPNHQHAPHFLAVPFADVAAGMDQTYPLTGNITHMHTITVTADQFATLAARGSVMIETTIYTSPDYSHTHYVQIACG